MINTFNRKITYKIYNLMNSVRRCTTNFGNKCTLTYKSLILVVTFLFILYILIIYKRITLPLVILPFFRESGNDDTCKYGIIFDAGSTGSRLHVFRLKPTAGGKSFTLVDELFLQIKPGLSFYRDDPNKGAESLRHLMDAAKRYIPRAKWSVTPISLKATAGLRMLPERIADDLLKGITRLFKSYPFISTGTSVQIMEGNDEGIFSWVTVNLLKGSIGNNASPVNAVLDLGGGSTQITFVPSVEDPKEFFNNGSDDYFTEFNLFSDHFMLYTHSYLGMGLISSRLSILKTNLTGELPEVLSSACLPSYYSETLSFNGKKYAVSGANEHENDRFARCLHDVKMVVSAVPMHHPVALLSNDSRLCLISYFYDMAVDANIIDKERGGIITIKEFKIAAKKVCSESKVRSNPFLCMDLTYISTLLLDGYQFKSKMNVELRKKIGGTEISWALGAMFNMLSNN